jgi:DnaK suppressor protein
MTAITTPHRAQLTHAQVAELRKRLLAELELHRPTTSPSSPVTDAPERAAEVMDEAEVSLEQHEAISRAEHDEAHVAEVERALAKMDKGTYGVSERSGEPIGYARLSAVPWAKLTEAEQEDLDR